MSMTLAALAVWVSGVSIGFHGNAQPDRHGTTIEVTASPTSAAVVPAKAPAFPTPTASPVHRLPGEPARRSTASRSGASQASATPMPGAVTIVIKRLGIRAPVFDRGVNADGTLAIAPGYSLTHLRFSARLGTWGNYVLYGHDDIDHEILRYLPDLRPGDRIDLYRGTVHFIYQVIDRKFVPPTDVGVMDQTAEPILTIISCYPYGVDTERIVVLASLTGVDDSTGAPS